MSIIIECKNICKEYGDKTILNNISLKFYSNEKIGIVGNNGCGKTTLADILSKEKFNPRWTYKSYRSTCSRTIRKFLIKNTVCW